jgi:hypothetical protein
VFDPSRFDPGGEAELHPNGPWLGKEKTEKRRATGLDHIRAFSVTYPLFLDQCCHTIGCHSDTAPESKSKNSTKKGPSWHTCYFVRCIDFKFNIIGEQLVLVSMLCM